MKEGKDGMPGDLDKLEGDGRIVLLGSVDSTNRYAKTLAAQGAAGGTLVAADTQTAGRGRRGRGWISPAGEGIFMSLIVRPTCPAERAAGLSLVTAVAVCRAIRRVTGLDARIKWPNDIVCRGKKISGMLLEMDAEAGALRSVVAGIGINVHQKAFAPEIAHTASSLDLLTGREISRAQVVLAFLDEFDETMALEGRDHEAFMREYCGLSATLGQRVQVVGLTGTYVGTAEAVTDSGTLMVRDEKGALREVLAADVSVRGIMGYV